MKCSLPECNKKVVPRKSGGTPQKYCCLAHQRRAAGRRRNHKAEYAAHRTRCIATSHKWRTTHPERIVKSNRERFRSMVLSDQSRYLWYKAKTRARDRGLSFDLTPEDLPVPDVCPVLGIPLFHGAKTRCDNSPTVDRLRPELGYIKGNARVISWRANALKSNGTLEELQKIVAYMRGEK